MAGLSVTASRQAADASFLRQNASERRATRFFEIGAAPPVSAERDLVEARRPHSGGAGVRRQRIARCIRARFSRSTCRSLVIDLVVANVLLALGMQMLQSQPSELALQAFAIVAIDGWGLLAQTLVTGYKF